MFPFSICVNLGHGRKENTGIVWSVSACLCRESECCLFWIVCFCFFCLFLSSYQRDRGPGLSGSILQCRLLWRISSVLNAIDPFCIVVNNPWSKWNLPFPNNTVSPMACFSVLADYRIDSHHGWFNLAVGCLSIQFGHGWLVGSVTVGVDLGSCHGWMDLVVRSGSFFQYTSMDAVSIPTASLSLRSIAPASIFLVKLM